MADIKDYIKALKEGNGYGWIARHGWELNKEELINIIKELDYAASHSIEFEDIYNEAALNLYETYVEEY